MKKSLSILAILLLMVNAVQADDVTVEKTSFKDGTTTSTSMDFALDDNITLSVTNNNNCTPGISGNQIIVSYSTTCTISLEAKDNTTLKSVEIEFGESKASTNFNASNSTSGINISGNKATYSGETTSFSMLYSLNSSGLVPAFGTVSIISVKVTYDDGWIKVNDYATFYKAVKDNPAGKIKLTKNINLLNLYFYNPDLGTTLFESMTFTGKISGENPGGNDFIINGGYSSSCSGLFNKASGATFSHLSLEDFYHFYEENKVAVLAKESYNCKYEYITINGCWTRSDGSSYGVNNSEVGGIVAISNNDVMSHCTISSSSEFDAKTHIDDSNLGGFAGKAYNSTFTYCHNAGKIYGNDNQVGGIVGYSEGCTFDHCLNTGTVYGNELVGGIVGHAKAGTVIKRCVNTGNIDFGHSYLDSTGDRRGGIVGEMDGSATTISQCLNFGNVYYCDDDCGALEGCTKDGATGAYNTHSYYYCTYNGKSNQNNEKEYTEENSIYRLAKMKSGEFAYKSTVDEAGTEKWLYQSIDNNNGFATTYPVPIPSAGTVYCNVLCNGTETFSNDSTYRSTAAHPGEPDLNGYCIKCGNYIGTGELHVKSAAYLCEFAKAINNGTDYSGSTVYLDDDIDMTDADFEPIGTSEHPFHGTFDGQGHRIKNLTINNTDDTYTGFFGYVGGYNAVTTTTIKNVIIDSSCSITSTGTGVAGLIGGVTSTSNILCTVTIQNCGNEAPVTGNKNVAGILGGMYGNNNTKLYIINSFNTGTITGGLESAAICGYARDSYYIVNCYNSGTVTGNEANKSFFRYSSSSSYYFRTTSNCYDVNADQTGVTKITSDQVRLGSLCNILNTNHGDYSAWTQDLENNTHPVFGTTAAVTYTRSTENQWGTIVLPFDVTVNEDDLYYIYGISSIANNTIMLAKQTNTLTAGTPAIICTKDAAKNATTGLYDLSLTASGDIQTTITNPSAVEGLTLTGNYSQEDITSTDGYKLDGNSFKKISTLTSESVATVSCEPFHAYLAGTLTGNPDQLTLDGETFLNIITSAQGLVAFATAVNSGVYNSEDEVSLANDIDMQGVDFTPIGTSEHPYNGTFDGQGHRIKNLTINNTTGYTGLFGYVGGYNDATTTIIKNVIIDSSCSITSTATGVAGLIGGVTSTSGKSCNVTIQNCGNEAPITGTKNVAGLVGGVYINDNSNLYVNNSYNIGAINGTSESATLCGWARKNFTIKNCYNTGSLTGGESGSLFFRHTSTGSQTVSNCYDINGSQTGVEQITADDVALGILCQKLIAGSSSSSAKAMKAMRKASANAFGEIELGNSVWAQDIATDSTPTFGEGGLTYTRKSAFRFGAIVLPFDVAIDNSNPYEFYILSLVSSGDTIVVRKMTDGVLAAGTPAFLVMKEEAKDDETNIFGLSFAAAPDANTTTTVDNSLSVGGFTLKGVFHATDITDEAGYVANSDTVVSISTLAEMVGNIICPAFNAYISGSLSINPLSLTILFDVGNIDNPTAIDAITNSLGGSYKQVFDLNGRRVNDLQRGVNIVKFSDGSTKKIVVK